MIYAPELAASALNIEPLGYPSPKGCECCKCGRPIEVGDLTVPFKAQSTFMDGRELCGQGRELCGYCAAHWNKTTMMALQKFCATKDKA